MLEKRTSKQKHIAFPASCFERDNLPLDYKCRYSPSKIISHMPTLHTCLHGHTRTHTHIRGYEKHCLPGYLTKTQKAQTKKKTDIFNYIKINNLCSSEDITKE